MPQGLVASALLTVLASTLCGCAGTAPNAGERLVADLERDYAPTPREGEAPRDQDPVSWEGTRPVTLADLLTLAEHASPDLAVARINVGIAASDAWQASLYPNPRIELDTEDLSLSSGVSGSKTTLGIVQPIVLGDRRRTAVDTATAVQEVRLAEVEARRRALFGDVAVSYARLVALGDQQRLEEELRNLATRTLVAAQARLDARAAPETDVIRPRVELHRIDAALARLAQERLAVTRQLGLLVGGVDLGSVQVADASPLNPPPLDPQELGRAVRAAHPSLVAAEREVDAAIARIAQLSAESVPDLDARLAAGYRGEEGDAIVELGLGMTVPLWDDRRGEAASLRLQVLRARQERTGVENSLLSELVAAVGEYEAARVQLEVFRDSIVPDAGRAFDQTTEAYRAGRATFLELFDAQRTMAEARLMVAELAGAAAVARARIAGVVGPDALPGTGPGAPSMIVPVDSVPSQERPEGAEVSP